MLDVFLVDNFSKPQKMKNAIIFFYKNISGIDKIKNVFYSDVTNTITILDFFWVDGNRIGNTFG